MSCSRVLKVMSSEAQTGGVTTSVSLVSTLSATTCIDGQNAKTRKCISVAAEIDPQNQSEKECLNVSLAEPLDFAVPVDWA